MRTVPSGLASHLALECTSLATCFALTRRDGQRFFLTDHDVDLVVGADTYLSAEGYTRSALAAREGFVVDNIELSGFFGVGGITLTAVRQGLFDYSDAHLFVVNHQDLSQGSLTLARGVLGEAVHDGDGGYSFEIRGLMQRLRAKTTPVYTPECRVDLGSSLCKVPIDPALIQRSTAYALGDFVRVITDGAETGAARFENRIYECTTAGTTAGSAPTYDTTVAAVTSDGSAAFTARRAFARHAVVATVTDRRVFTVTVAESRAVDGWFAGGVAVFETGNNAGIVAEVKTWTQGTARVVLYLPLLAEITVGDKLALVPGCDKRFATCITKWDIDGSRDFSEAGNFLNFRGFPHLPGQDQVMAYPDAP